VGGGGAHRWSPERMTMSWMERFFMSSNSQAYCRTASAVPWNHSLSVGVCVAASTSTNPSPPNRTPLPKLYVRARCLQVGRNKSRWDYHTDLH